MGAIKIQPEHFRLSGSEVFLSAHLAKRGTGRATTFSGSRLSSGFIKAWVDETCALLGCPLPEIEFKVVGPLPGLTEMEGILRGMHVRLKSVSRRESPALEILFYPADGRVRVAEGTAAPAARPTPVAAARKLRVLIVDDSPTIRKLLTNILGSDPGLEVVGEAERPSLVAKKIRDLKPDVVTLDLHMPEMDGVQCLRGYLPDYPIPTVIISSISMEEGPLVLSALEAGAIDYIQKPTLDQLAAVTPTIIEKVKTAARAKIQRTYRVRTPNAADRVSAFRMDRVLAFGSSTGGTEALTSILTRFPAEIPPVICVQHIPAVFSAAFAKRLDTLCPFDVKEAEDGDEVRAGRVLIAPGGFQMSVVRGKGGKLVVKIEDSAPVNRHKPSVDVLFNSVAKEIGPTALGIILTGMGADGADGLVEMRKIGCRTIAQDEATSVVFGMPREAILRGGAEATVPLPEIPDVLAQWLTPKGK